MVSIECQKAVMLLSRLNAHILRVFYSVLAEIQTIPPLKTLAPCFHLAEFFQSTTPKFLLLLSIEKDFYFIFH